MNPQSLAGHDQQSLKQLQLPFDALVIGRVVDQVWQIPHHPTCNWPRYGFGFGSRHAESALTFTGYLLDSFGVSG